MVSQKRDLDYISFNWNKMTASEFEEHWRENKISKEVDFIHMIQVGAAAVILLTQRLYFNHNWNIFFLLSVHLIFNRCCTTWRILKLQRASSTAS